MASRWRTTLLLIAIYGAAIVAADCLAGWLFPGHPVYLNKKQYSYDCYPSNPRGYFDQRLETPDGQAVFCVDRSGEDGSQRGYGDPKIPPDCLCILFIGDSFTYGQGVKLKDTFSKRIEDARIAGRSLCGINLGRGGTGVREIQESLEKSIDLYRPDYVVYSYVLNDTIVEPSPERPFRWLDSAGQGAPGADCGFLWDFMHIRTPNVVHLRNPLLATLASHSNIIDLLLSQLELERISRNTVQHYQQLHSFEYNHAGLQKTRARIGAMQHLAQQHQAKFLVLLFPLFFQIGPEYPFADSHRTLAAALRQADIDVLDLAPLYEVSGYDTEALWVHPGDQHPNQHAHRIAAEALLAWLRRRAEPG